MVAAREFLSAQDLRVSLHPKMELKKVSQMPCKGACFTYCPCPGLPCGDYPAPFPSPDHNYCISPVKGEAAEVKGEAVEVKGEGAEVKEEGVEVKEAVEELVKVEPAEQETPTGRRPSRVTASPQEILLLLLSF